MQTKTPPIVFLVPRHLKDRRLDVALFTLIKEKYPEKKELSRGFVIRMIRGGQVTLNGKLAKPSALVLLYDKIKIEDGKTLFLDKVSLQTNDRKISIKIFFDDKHVLVINKPGNLQMYPAGRRVNDTLANWLITKYPKLKNVGENILRPGIVHRLDRETSGILVIAKTERSFAQLKKLFQDRVVHKTYVALVYGNLKSSQGVVDKPLMRQSGELKRRIIEKEDTTTTLKGNIRSAVTEYQVITRYRDFDLVLLFPKTGRTHQLRAHLASLGHPIVGDKLYAFKPMRYGKALFPQRQMLHAWRLQWNLFGHAYDFLAPLPEDFRRVLAGVDETHVAVYDGEALKSLLAE